MSNEVTDAQSGDLLSPKQTATILGVTEGTLAVWASTKRYDLPYVKIGRLRKYQRKHIDAFIKRRTVGAKA